MSLSTYINQSCFILKHSRFIPQKASKFNKPFHPLKACLKAPFNLQILNLWCVEILIFSGIFRHYFPLIRCVYNVHKRKKKKKYWSSGKRNKNMRWRKHENNFGTYHWMRFLVSNTKFIIIQNKSKVTKNRIRGDKIRRKIQMDTTREGKDFTEWMWAFKEKTRKLICRLKKKKKNFFPFFFVLSLIKSNLLTADPRLSVHPPKQDVDFFICCGR